MNNPFAEITIPGLRLFKKGKVREVYDLEDHLLVVASDRISAFDFVLPSLIPDKGKVLTQISMRWIVFPRNSTRIGIFSRSGRCS